MGRQQDILDLFNPQASLERQKDACISLRNLNEDEPEFEAAMQVLMSAARNESEIRDLAQSALDTINEKRYTQARRAVMQGWQETIPEGISDATTLIRIFEDKSESWERRSAACLALGELNPPGVVRVLMGAFKDNAELAFNVGNALATVHRLLNRPVFEATEELTVIARKDREERFREAALYALRWVGDPRATEVAMEIFDSSESSPELRRAALEILARGMNSNAHILRALRDTSPLVRIAAIGIANTTLSEVRDAIMSLLHDHSRARGEGTVAEAVRSKLQLQGH